MATIPDALKDADAFKGRLDQLAASPVISLDYTSNPATDDEGGWNATFASDEALVTRKGEWGSTDYRASIDGIYYNLYIGSDGAASGNRVKIDPNGNDYYYDGFSAVTEKVADGEVANLKEEYGLEAALDEYNGILLPYEANYAEGHLDYDIEADAAGYTAYLDFYYEPATGNAISYQADFTFDADVELKEIWCQVELYDLADWDKETHAKKEGATPLSKDVYDLGDIVFGTPAATDPDSPLREDIHDYYVTEITSGALTGQTAYIDGIASYQIGDTPALGEGTTYLPETAVNLDMISLTGASDPTYLAVDEMSYTGGYVFAKSGTVDLYFGDSINPRLYVAEDVVVYPKQPVIPTFNFVDTETANGCQVEDVYDDNWNLLGQTLTIALGDGTDELKIMVGQEGPYDLDGLSYTTSLPGIVEIAFKEDPNSNPMTSGYSSILAEITPLGLGTTDVVIKSGNPSAVYDWEREINLEITVVEGGSSTTGGDWTDVTLGWSDSIFGGIGLPQLPEPAFEYAEATFEGTYNGDVDHGTLTVHADADSLDLYATALEGVGWQYMASTADGIWIYMYYLADFDISVFAYPYYDTAAGTLVVYFSTDQTGADAPSLLGAWKEVTDAWNASYFGLQGLAAPSRPEFAYGEASYVPTIKTDEAAPDSGTLTIVTEETNLASYGLALTMAGYMMQGSTEAGVDFYVYFDEVSELTVVAYLYYDAVQGAIVVYYTTDMSMADAPVPPTAGNPLWESF